MKNNNVLVRLSVWLIINLHQKRYSKYRQRKGARCRFYPSCSNYGIMALQKYGFVYGWIKAIWRIWRCNPWNSSTCVDYP